MINSVLVGDLHGKKNNIEESMAIIQWSIQEAKSRSACLIFLGDLLNDFGVLRVETLLFVDWAFKELENSGLEVFIIKGNHDENSQGTMTYLQLWVNRNPKIHVILQPTQFGNVLFVPFIREHKSFKEVLEAHPTADTVVCHQEFDGCMYENGFYSPHGFKADQIPQHVKSVVSGHIHKTQQLGSSELPIAYIGIPRHLSKSDLTHTPVIGVTSDLKAIELIEVPELVAPRFHSILIDETFTKPQIKELMKTPDRSRFYIEISGSKLFINKLLKAHDWTGFKVKTNPSDQRQEAAFVKESDGIKKSFGNYIFSYADKNGLGQAEVKAIVELYRELVPELVM